MRKSKISKVDEDLNQEMGYSTERLNKIDKERWNTMCEKGDPRTRDLWDHTPISYDDRKQRCNSKSNSRAYWAFRCDKETHEKNVVRDYLINHNLPVPEDFNNPVELQPTGLAITQPKDPAVAKTPEPQTPNLREMWAAEHDVKIVAPIHNNNIFILTDKEHFDQILEKVIQQR